MNYSSRDPAVFYAVYSLCVKQKGGHCREKQNFVRNNLEQYLEVKTIGLLVVFREGDMIL